MHTIVVIVHVTMAVILVLTVLLQAGRGAGMGAAFGGSSASLFGSRGPTTLISKITCAAAVIFMVTSLNLSLFQKNRGGSLMEGYQPPAPVADSASPAPQEASPAPQEASPVDSEQGAE